MAACQPRCGAPCSRARRQLRRERQGLSWTGFAWRLPAVVTLTISLSAAPSTAEGAGGITAAQLGKSAAGLSSPSPLNILEKGIPRAVSRAKLEQEIEDLNIMHKYDKRMERLAMVMPLTELFDPGVTAFAHEHLQEGDKISFPPSVMADLLRRQAEIPWQLQIQLVRRKDPGKFEPVEVPTPPREALHGKKEMPQLSSVACSILDARSPEQFIFIPNWMMKALRLKPRDIVRYRHKDLSKASKIVLQPHSSAFLKMSNHQAIMETELRHYSAISRGTTIAFRYRKKLHEFNVLECIDTDGKSQEAVCVQDSDVATDFQPALDTPAGRRPPKVSATEHVSVQGQQDAGAELADEAGDSDEEDEEEGEEGWGDDEF